MSSFKEPYTLGGKPHVRFNVTTASCADTEACIDISILVFLVVILSLAIVGLIGVKKILRWLCCRFSCNKPSRETTDTRLLDGDNQISRLYVFGPLGLKDYGSATLRCKI